MASNLAIKDKDDRFQYAVVPKPFRPDYPVSTEAGARGLIDTLSRMRATYREEARRLIKQLRQVRHLFTTAESQTEAKIAAAEIDRITDRIQRMRRNHSSIVMTARHMRPATVLLSAAQ